MLGTRDSGSGLSRLLVALALLAAPGCAKPRSTPVENPAPTPGFPFRNQIQSSGIDFALHRSRGAETTILDTIGHGIAVIDFNGDDRQDLVFLGPDQVRAYRNLGEFKFEPVDLGFRQRGIWGGAAVGDVDNNGWPDLYLTGYGCSALYLNFDGSFRDVTEDAGLKSRSLGNYPAWGTSAGFADLDRDGYVDLVVCRYLEFGPDSPKRCETHVKGVKVVCAPKVYAPQKPAVYRNVGHGRFTDATAGWNVIGHGNALGVAFCDVDNNGDVAVAIANDERPGDLFVKEGAQFREIGAASATAFDSRGQVHGGMGLDWGDADNDGLFDLAMMTFFLEDKNLYRNLGNRIFEDVGQKWGLHAAMRSDVGFGVRLIDWDNDGRLDLAAANGHIQENAEVLRPTEKYRQPFRLLRGRGDRFDLVTPQQEMTLVGRSLAAADLDNDGGMDLIVGDLEGPPLLLRNQAELGNWIGIKLEGTRSNRMGLGATIEMNTAGGKRRFYATTAGSYMASQDSRIHIGVGDQTEVDLTVEWPSGKRSVLSSVAVNQWIKTLEAAAK